MYKVYSKEGCPFCARSLIALKTFDKEFEVLKLDEDYFLQEFLDVVPDNHRTYPAIFNDGVFVGGFSELKEEIFK